MKKEKPAIKTTLSMEDRILMPQELAEGYFTSDSEGRVSYTPYYTDMMLINVFFLHCVDGIAFEVKETEGGKNEIAENIYEAVTKDAELMKLYGEFFEQDKGTILSHPARTKRPASRCTASSRTRKRW